MTANKEFLRMASVLAYVFGCSKERRIFCYTLLLKACLLIVIFFNFVGKFPHIIVSASGKPSTALGRENLEAVIQFGPTAVGTTVQKMVELHNLSPVSTLHCHHHYHHISPGPLA